MARAPRIRSTQGLPVGARIAPVLSGRAAAAPGASLARFGESTQRLGVVIKNEEKRIERQDNALWVSRESARIQKEWQEHLINKQREAPEGAKGFAGSVSQEFKEFRDKSLDAAPNRETRMALQARLDNFGVLVAGQALRFEAKSQLKKNLSDLDATLQNKVNVVLSNPNSYEQMRGELKQDIEQMEGLNGDQRRELQTKAERAVTEAYARGLIEQNPYAAEKTLDSGALDKRLSAKQKATLISAAETEQRRREARARAEKAAQDRDLARTIKEGMKLMGEGIVPPNMPDLINKAKGTKFEPLVKLMEVNMGTISAFSLANPEQQRLIIDKISGDLRQGKSKSVTNDKFLLDAFQRINNKLLQDIKNDGLSVGKRLGLIKEDVPPINWSQLDPQMLQQRQSVADRLSTHFRQTVLPFTSDELRSLNFIWGKLDSTGRTALLSQLSAGLDEDIMKNLGQQVAKDNPIFGMAASVSRTNPEASELMIQGQAILKQIPELKPKRSEYFPDWKSHIGLTFGHSPVTERAAIDATIAIYAKLQHMRGADAGEYDEDTFKKAAQIATGGRYDPRTGEVVGGAFEYRDRRIMPPEAGMTEEQFDKLVTGLDIDVVKAHSFVKTGDKLEPAGILHHKNGQVLTKREFDRHVQFQQVGPGEYLMYLPNSRGYILGRNQQPAVLNLLRYLEQTRTVEP